MTKFTIRYVVLDKKEIHTLNFFSLGYICCFSSSIPKILFSPGYICCFFSSIPKIFFSAWVYLRFFLIHTQNFFLAWVYLLFFIIHTQNHSIQVVKSDAITNSPKSIYFFIIFYKHFSINHFSSRFPSFYKKRL